MKKFFFFIFMITLVNCSKSIANADLSVKEVTEMWLQALQNKNSEKIFNLIEPAGRLNLESNLKLYFQTILDLASEDNKNSKEIQKILELTGEPFLKAFLTWEENISPSRNFEYSISEIQTSSKVSSVTLLVGDNIKKINLVKVNNNWYIKTDSL